MIRSLRTGVSGLKSNQTQLDVVSNNIANANTVAFKRSRAAFNEVLGQEMLGVGRTAGGSGINPSSVGLGVSVGSIDQNWSQGSLDSTGIKTDLALQGDGFFIAQGNDRRLMTRAGNFSFNRNGELVTSSGLNVQGYAFDDQGKVNTAQLEDVALDPNEQVASKPSTLAEIGGNLSSELENTATSQVTMDGSLSGSAASGDTVDKSITVNKSDGTSVDLDVRFTSTGTADEWDVKYQTDGGGYSSATTINVGTDSDVNLGDIVGTGQDVKLDISGLQSSTTSDTTISQNGNPEAVTSISTGVYDAQGKKHTATIEFRKTGKDTWEYTVKHSGNGPNPFGNENASGNMIGQTATGTIKFGTKGNVQSIKDDSGNNIENPQLDWNTGFVGDGSSVSFDIANLAQRAGSTTVAVQDTDGQAAGQLTGYAISPEGVLQANFSNGEQKEISQLAIGSVNNPNGLQQEGENFYSVTGASGDLQLGRAGRDLDTAVVSGTLEASNVDIAKEFTEMITAQRGYQASARVITTSDEMLQEAVQLKR